MSELDWAELQRFENIKQQLDYAKQTGLDKKIPFLDFYKADVESHINFLQPNANVIETDDEKKKKDGALNVAAAAMAEQQREISHFAEHGFNSRGDFYNFADKLKDKEYMAAFDAMSDEEKTKTANRFLSDLDKAVKDKKITKDDAEELKQRPEIRHMTEFAGAQYTKEKEKDRSFTAGLRDNIEKLNDHELAAQAQLLSNGVQGSDSRNSNEKKMVLAASLADGVFDLAKNNGIANHKAELEKTIEIKNEKFDDLFASSEDFKDVAKAAKSGIENDAVVAAKPTEVQIALNSVGKDHGMGTPA